MPSRTARPTSESRGLEFVRRFIEAIPSCDMQAASIPRKQDISFFIPITSTGQGGTVPLAVGFHFKPVSKLAKALLVSGGEVLSSNLMRFKLTRADRSQMSRWEAFRILYGGIGPIFGPIVWDLKIRKPADFGHQADAGSSISIEATGSWVYRVLTIVDERYTVRYSLVLEAEPSPRAYLRISISSQLRSVWEVHSQWVPLAGAGWIPGSPFLQEDKDGEARNQS
jgi:hypothetical protein